MGEAGPGCTVVEGGGRLLVAVYQTLVLPLDWESKVSEHAMDLMVHACLPASPPTCLYAGLPSNHPTAYMAISLPVQVLKCLPIHTSLGALIYTC